MIKSAVIGHPISHSLSPVIHGYWFKKYNIDGAYQAIDIAPDQLPSRVLDLRAQGYAGFNVTVPHKQNMMTLCDMLDNTAHAIGAVNTVVIEDNKIMGRNTDAFGYIENIKQEAPNFNFKNGPALVLGAGGAARAIVYGLLSEGVREIFITNRTRANAEIIARDFENVRVVDWAEREKACNDAHLLTNTTVLGMKGQDELAMDISSLSPTSLVCDIVYKPLMTTLLQHALMRNLQVVTGIGMLLHQARPAFAAWSGIMPEVTPELVNMIKERAL